MNIFILKSGIDPLETTQSKKKCIKKSLDIFQDFIFNTYKRSFVAFSRTEQLSLCVIPFSFSSTKKIYRLYLLSRKAPPLQTN